MAFLILPSASCYDGEVRLGNESSYYNYTDFGSFYINEGRVEVCYNGQFGSVCSVGWDDRDAEVICRQRGYQSPEYGIAL